MLNRTSSLARFLTEISVQRPLVTAGIGLVVTLSLAFQAAQISSEVGYAAYFGPVVGETEPVHAERRIPGESVGEIIDGEYRVVS